MSAHYKIMCDCECCISAKIIHSSLLSWHDRYSEKLRDKIQYAQSRRSAEKAHNIYETYKNIVMPHWRHNYSKASDMAKAIMRTYPQCCAECPHINLPDQEKNKNKRKKHPQLGFTFITSLNVVLLMVYFY